jgi:tetratricopeptide (TPR) repeat protein
VLVIGDSAAGKSRSAAQAAREIDALQERRLLVPDKDRQGLTCLIDANVPLANTLVWLEDIDKHLSNGLGVGVLKRLPAEVPDVVILCTVRSSQLKELQKELKDPAWKFLMAEHVVSRIDLPGDLSDQELRDARKTFTNPSLLAALEKGVGLGEYLVGGPELVKKLKLATGYERRLADVTIGWYRTGLSQPISLSKLRRLWVVTLPDPLASSYHDLPPKAQKQKFDQALKWACKPILTRDAYNVVLLSKRRDGYEANDYVVDHIARQHDRPAIDRPLWEAALRVALSEQQILRLWRVGLAASEEGQHEVALSAMTVLDEVQGAEDIAAMGVLYVKGFALGKLERHEEALAAYEKVVERFGKTEEPELSELVAKALVEKGVALGRLRRAADERAAYREVVERFGDSDEPVLREQVARALVNTGVTLGRLGHLEEALAAYEEVIERFGESDEPKLRVVHQFRFLLLGAGVSVYAARHP